LVFELDRTHLLHQQLQGFVALALLDQAQVLVAHRDESRAVLLHARQDLLTLVGPDERPSVSICLAIDARAVATCSLDRLTMSSDVVNARLRNWMACTFTPSASMPMDLVMGMRVKTMSLSAACWLAERHSATP